MVRQMMNSRPVLPCIPEMQGATPLRDGTPHDTLTGVDPIEFDAGDDEEFFARFQPPRRCLCCVRIGPGAEPYVSKTVNLRRRLQRLLSAAEGRRLSLRERVSAAEWCEVGGEFEAGFALYRLLRTEFPEKYASGCICGQRRCCNCCGTILIRGLR